MESLKYFMKPCKAVPVWVRLFREDGSHLHAFEEPAHAPTYLFQVRLG